MMTDTQKTKLTKNADKIPNNVCGIVMPISHMSDEYTKEHWEKVRKIIEKSIKKANFTPRVVWEDPNIDIIQSKILQNIYENDVIICDLSNLNPNVMFEAGLRLSTKKPTILITDTETKPPFDMHSIGYIPYPKNLEYNQIDEFIDALSEKISLVHDAYTQNKYKSFFDSYQFEVATPSTIEIKSAEKLEKQMDEIMLLLTKTIKRKNNTIEYSKDNKKVKYINFILRQNEKEVSDLMKEYSNLNFVKYCSHSKRADESCSCIICMDDAADDLDYFDLKNLLLGKNAEFI